MRQFFAVLSFVVLMGVLVPYIKDILKGSVRPSRATRIMFFIMLLLALVQQHSLGSGYAIVITVAEFLSAVLLLGLAVKHGVGGLSRSDIVCYVLLAVDMGVWLMTNNALLALHLTVLADIVAFWPTLLKTYYDPTSETPIFYWGGVIAPVLGLFAEQSLTYAIILFPLYLSAINAVELLLIYRGRFVPPTAVQ